MLASFRLIPGSILPKTGTNPFVLVRNDPTFFNAFRCFLFLVIVAFVRFIIVKRLHVNIFRIFLFSFFRRCMYVERAFKFLVNSVCKYCILLFHSLHMECHCQSSLYYCNTVISLQNLHCTFCHKRAKAGKFRELLWKLLQGTFCCHFIVILNFFTKNLPTI